MKNRGKINFGILMILIGGVLYARQFYPQMDIIFTWPYWGIALGVLMILSAVILKEGGLAVFGSILAGISSNILLQLEYGGTTWISMLAFLGVGLILSDLVDHHDRVDWRTGLTLVLISTMVFLITGGSKLLPWPQVSSYWPIALILFGVALLISAAFGGKKQN